MSTLQDIEAIPKHLLFQVGDEQMPMPMNAALTLVFPDGSISTYSAQHNRAGEDVPIITSRTFVTPAEEDEV